jgi:hypothetical protein
MFPSMFDIRNSKIHGVGLFTKVPYKRGEKLFIAITSEHKVTRLGSKINHCPCTDPISVTKINTVLAQDSNGDWWSVATRDLNANEELTADYTYSPDFIQRPDPVWRC